jgi:hypothetical protein
LQRLILEFDFRAVVPQLARAQVNLEISEADNPCCEIGN